MRAKHRERGGSSGAWRRGLATCQAFVSPQRGALPTLRMNTMDAPASTWVATVENTGHPRVSASARGGVSPGPRALEH